jgi:phosphomannomutase / phosphoglucomutase
MIDSAFREYDIRGKVGTELNIDEIYHLARTMAAYFVHYNPQVKTVAVGMDGRTHSAQIKAELCRGLMDSGLDVLFIGMCPTPVMYFSLYQLPVDAGLMITASHNPKEFNGIKICLGTEVVWGAKLRELRDWYKQQIFHPSSKKGIYREHLLINEYVDFLATHFAHLKGMDMPFIIDCGNGAAGTVIPQLITAMEFKNVELLFPEVDGTYPNHEPDPVNEKNMGALKARLALGDAALGIGLDGDGDRMAPMTKNGRVVPGDKLLGIFSVAVAQQFPGASVVFDIKSSGALIELLESIGCVPHMSPAGHSIIKTQMKLHNAILGGELSCHFFFADRYFGYDDGIYATLRLLELLVQSGKTLEELLAKFPHKISSTEIRIQCPDDRKEGIVQAVKKQFAERSDVTLITIDGVRAAMSYGWGMVRSSNTQPELCLRFESDTQEGLAHVKKDFAHALAPFIDTALLRDAL